MREKLFETAGVPDPSKHTTVIEKQDLTKETTSFRVLLRSKDYLSHPEKESTHTSLSGLPLNEDLKSFCPSSRKIRDNFIDFLVKEELNSELKPPKQAFFRHRGIPVTEKEKQDSESIHNKTKDEIKELISGSLNKVSDVELKEALQNTYETDISKASKSDLLEFYSQIVACIEAEDIEHLRSNERQDSGD